MKILLQNGEANNLIFKDKTFDKFFCFGQFYYFPNQKYDKKAILIGDLPIVLHREEHLLYDKNDFKDWKVIDGYYNPNRFNVVWKL